MLNPIVIAGNLTHQRGRVGETCGPSEHRNCAVAIVSPRELGGKTSHPNQTDGPAAEEPHVSLGVRNGTTGCSRIVSSARRRRQ